MLLLDAIDEYIRIKKKLDRDELVLSPGLKQRVLYLERFIEENTHTKVSEIVTRRAFFASMKKD